MKSFSQPLLVTSHTDHVGPQTTFVAIKGFKEDGNSYILKALSKGAKRIVVDEHTDLNQEILQVLDYHHAELLRVPSTRKALSNLAAEAYGYPAKHLKIIGITGTKGKTTTAFLLEHILKTAGYKTALLGTVKYSILNQEYEAPLTTPQPDFLHAFFAECKARGIEYVVMEVAAQALSVHRLDDVRFDATVFTNFSLEHSEFYAHIDEYFAAKCQIYALMDPHGVSIINADDDRVKQSVPSHIMSETVSMRGCGSYSGKLINSGLTGLQLDVTTPYKSYTLSCQALLGEFSAYNLLSSIAVAHRYNIEHEVVQKALDSFEGVPGRIWRYELPNKSVAVIDNAHTPSSFEALFTAVRPLSSHVIAVFGAGGDRDTLKRPLMGAIAAQHADYIILTMDNPRSEEALDITKAIMEGIPAKDRHKVTIDLDRERAIKTAYTMTQPGSLMLLLGKGPVEYQHIKDQKIPFSEVGVLRTLRS